MRRPLLFLLLLLLATGCSREPVDLLCVAVADAAAAPAWTGAEPDGRVGMVAESWPGGAVQDPWGEVPEVEGVQPWERASRLRALLPAGSRRARGCVTAVEWAAWDSWSRYGLVVTPAGGDLAAWGPDGSRDRLDDWPPRGNPIPGQLFYPLRDLARRVHEESPEPDRATLLLPEDRSPTIFQAVVMSATLTEAGFGEVRVVQALDEPPFTRMGVPERPESAALGPIEEVRILSVDPQLRESEQGLEVATFVRIGAVRGGRSPEQSIFPHTPGPDDPWGAAESAAAARVAIAGAEGCLLARLAPGDQARLREVLVERLRPLGLGGAVSMVAVPPGTSLSLTRQVDAALAEMEIGPVYFLPLPWEGDASCEAAVRSPGDLEALLTARKDAAGALFPVVDEPR